MLQCIFWVANVLCVKTYCIFAHIQVNKTTYSNFTIFTTMKKSSFLAFLFIAVTQWAMAAERDFYQIQTYRLSDKAQEVRMDKYLKTAYLPALHRAGIKTVGVFKPIASDTAAGNQIMVLVPLTSPDQLDKLQTTLAADATYQTAGADVLKAPHTNVAFARKQSTVLKAFKDAPRMFAPKFTTKRADQVFELRSYEGATEYLYSQKVKMFNEGGEIALFKKLGFNPVFFAEVLSGNVMPNLMYMISFSNMESHDTHWDAFGKHPDWKKMSSLDEYQNTVSNIIRVMYHPTDYSDL